MTPQCDDAAAVQAMRSLIRAVPDFPQAGVTFRDVTPLLADAEGFALCLERMAAPWREAHVQAVCGIEARGFIFGAALADRLRCAFVPLRKPGKLPPPVVAAEYELEYGRDRLEARADTLAPGARVLIVDDVLATGGTLAAARSLIGKLGARTIGASVLLELPALCGRARWKDDVPLQALLEF